MNRKPVILTTSFLLLTALVTASSSVPVGELTEIEEEKSYTVGDSSNVFNTESFDTNTVWIGERGISEERAMDFFIGSKKYWFYVCNVEEGKADISIETTEKSVSDVCPSNPGPEVPYVTGWDTSNTYLGEEFSLEEGSKIMHHFQDELLNIGGTLVVEDAYLKLKLHRMENGEARISTEEWVYEGDEEIRESLPEDSTASPGQYLWRDELFYCKNTENGAKILVDPEKQERWDCRSETAGKTSHEVPLASGESRSYYLEPGKTYDFQVDGKSLDIDYVSNSETRRYYNINGERYHTGQEIRLEEDKFASLQETRDWGSIDNDDLGRIVFRTREIESAENQKVKFESWIDRSARGDPDKERFHYVGGTRQLHAPGKTFDVTMEQGYFKVTDLKIEGEKWYNPCEGNTDGVYELDETYSLKITGENCGEYGEDITLSLERTEDIHRLSPRGVEDPSISFSNSMTLKNGQEYSLGEPPYSHKLKLKSVEGDSVEVKYESYMQHLKNEGYYGEFTMEEGEYLEILPNGERDYLKLEDTYTGQGIYTATFSAHDSVEDGNTVHTPENQKDDDGESGNDGDDGDNGDDRDSGDEGGTDQFTITAENGKIKAETRLTLRNGCMEARKEIERDGAEIDVRFYTKSTRSAREACTQQIRYRSVQAEKEVPPGEYVVNARKETSRATETTTETVDVGEGENSDEIEYTLGEKIQVNAGDTLKFGENRMKISSFTGEEKQYLRVKSTQNDKSGNIVEQTEESAITTDIDLKTGEYHMAGCRLEPEESRAEIIVSSEEEIDCASHGDDKEQEVSLNIEDTEITAGEEVEANIEVSPDRAKKGYQVKVTGPESRSESFQTATTTFKFTLEEPGEYTVKILPKVMGQNIPFIGEILQGGSLAETTFTLNRPGTEGWKNYCRQKEYDPEKIEQLTECLKEEILPNCFTQDPADSCTEDGENVVAASVCNYIPEYDYNPDTATCVP